MASLKRKYSKESSGEGATKEGGRSFEKIHSSEIHVSPAGLLAHCTVVSWESMFH